MNTLKRSHTLVLIAQLFSLPVSVLADHSITHSVQQRGNVDKPQSQSQLPQNNQQQQQLQMNRQAGSIDNARKARDATMDSSPWLLPNRGNTMFGEGAYSLPSVANGFPMTASRNTAMGDSALKYSGQSFDNAVFGANAGRTLSRGYFNTLMGADVLMNAQAGERNTAIGWGALRSSLSAEGGGFYAARNTVIGAEAAKDLQNGFDNVAIGAGSGRGWRDAHNNIAIGNRGLERDERTIRIGLPQSQASGLGPGDRSSYHTRTFIAGIRNSLTPAGVPVLVMPDGQLGVASTSLDASNTLLGVGTANQLERGSYNVAIGQAAGNQWRRGGSYNVAIAASGQDGESYTLRIGEQQNRTFIAGIFQNHSAATGGLPVLIKQDGQLGVASSSQRYKTDIHSMGNLSDRLMRLRPVAFHYKENSAPNSSPWHYGLIAEDVAKVMPELVVNNKEGLPESVAYHVLPSLLLNEYQKQSRLLAETRETLDKTRQQLEESKTQYVAALEKLDADYQAKLSEFKQEVQTLLGAGSPRFAGVSARSR